MADLNALLEKRRINRMRYTKFEKLVTELQVLAERACDEDDDKRAKRLAVNEAIASFSKLKEIYEDLAEVQDGVDYHPDNEERMKSVADDREDHYTRSYLRVNAKNTYLDGILSEPIVENEKASSENSFTPEMFTKCFTEAMGSINTGVTEDQLEKILSTLTHKKRVIQIPKFKGDNDLFDTWKELVESEVQKPGYSDVEKAHLAISFVDGEVSKLVASLKDPSYEEIIEFLEHRYGDVLAKVEHAVNEIASLTAISSTTIKDLDPLYNKLLANWNYIQKRTKDDPKVVECSWILTALVRPKLPKSLIKRWDGERIKEEKRTHRTAEFPIPFNEMLEKLQDALQIARRAEPLSAKAKPETRREREKDYNHREKSKSSGYALNVTKKETSYHAENKSASCVFCDDSHQSHTCPKVKDMPVQDRCDRVKASKGCFNCLRKGHFVQTCRASHCQICKKNHHTLLHIERRFKRDERSSHDDSRSSERRNDVVESTVGLVRSISGQNEVLMLTGVAKLESKCAITRGRVLFDSGSGVTFISRRMTRTLGLSGPNVTGEFTLAGGGNITLNTERVKFCLSASIPNWRGEEFEIAAYVIDKPSADIGRVDVDLSKMNHLRGLQLADSYPRRESCEIDVMLGIEDTMNILLDRRIQGPSGTPFAQKSHIGWILCGPCPATKSNTQGVPSVNRVTFHLKEDIDIATKHWETEHIGILPHEDKGLTALEKSALEQHHQKTRRVGDRYETGLLRHPKYSEELLRNNKPLALNRLVSLERRLLRDPILAEQYRTQIKDLLSAGRAEKVDEKAEPSDHQIWYLPHHPVVKMDRATTKVRMVFDGSMSGYEGVSLNDTLLPGPALQPDLPAVLMRFRRRKIAIVADIEKMFLQVKMRDKDSDMQRFLWRDLEVSEEPQVYRLTTVTFGLAPSPFSSIQTLIDHVKTQRKEYPKAATEIEENIYVDDLLTGEDTIEEAATLALDLKNVLKTGGWPLRKFTSNKPEALSLLDEKDLASHQTKMVPGIETDTKTLGVIYEPKQDVLKFSFLDKMESAETETKRTVLKQLHRVFDPLGMITPFTVVAKQIFQMSWLTGKGWDERLPESLEHKWLKWKSEVSILDEIKVCRCLIPEDFKQPRYTLHGFGDASEAAYGAAIYLKIEDAETNRVYTTLLLSKTRVAPVGKKRTIPELELMAALINARLINYVEKELKLNLEQKTCWTDSQVVLHWIFQPAYTWQTFVANRVSEIQELVEPSSWKHVPGKHNPADLCSRGLSADALVNSSLWWNGPAFLLDGEKEWPKQPILEIEKKDEAQTKLKKKILQVLSVKQVEPDPLDDYVNRFSSYEKFIRVLIIVRSWLIRHRNKRMQGADEGSPGISLADIRNEEMNWIRRSQQKAFAEEIESLKRGEQLSKHSKLRRLDPYWDHEKEVVRVGGRLQYADLPDETKSPIILPTHDNFVEKLVMHCHVKNHHTGTAQTLASLRGQYWLIHGRQEVRRIIHNCRTCREPAKLSQKMAGLPIERTMVLPAFTNVGVDFAGPLYIRVYDTEQNKKAYICLFTCMVSRAIHLELVHDLTTEQFLMALTRMISRRGQCLRMFSDNAKTFKKAASILVKIFKTPENLKDQMSRQGIDWSFITEKAPWHGGFYERMVRSVKTALKRILGKAQLTFIEMETTLTEVEAQINSRPLTPVSSDKNDPTPITPGHLIIGRAPQNLPEVDKETKKTSLGKRWSYMQRLSKMFWNRWRQEYLLELNYLKKWLETKSNLRVGDVVLIVDDNNYRKQDWMLGRVEEIHPGRDGLVRSVTLKTSHGIRRRPIQRLRLLEAANDSDD